MNEWVNEMKWMILFSILGITWEEIQNLENFLIFFVSFFGIKKFKKKFKNKKKM